MHSVEYNTNHENCILDMLSAVPEVESDKYFSGGAIEAVSSLKHVFNYISTGDLALFSGCKPHSFLIRAFSYSRFSHAGIFLRDSKGLWIVDVCEGIGGSRRDPYIEVQQYPGQWYWSHVSRRRFPDFEDNEVATEILKMEGLKYGYLGILFQLAIHTPILRELAFALAIDRLKYFKNRPFCSQGVEDAIRNACRSCDPVPNRASSLVVPQDLAQSRLWHPMKVRLIP